MRTAAALTEASLHASLAALDGCFVLVSRRGAGSGATEITVAGTLAWHGRRHGAARFSVTTRHGRRLSFRLDRTASASGHFLDAARSLLEVAAPEAAMLIDCPRRRRVVTAAQLALGPR